MPVAHTEGPEHVHGRQEHRSVKVTAASGPAFPGARQAVRIGRCRREHGRARGSREIIFAVTDLDAYQVRPVELVAHARGHWTVENRAHYVRDVTFNEGRRWSRTKTAPGVLGCVADISGQVLAAAGWKNLASGRRAHTNPDKVPASTESPVLNPYGSKPR
ncbi:hypothetical protein [Allosalinactinospora lopnorensis]|uniref:hypothetical protein n=1 Tax=Allosalinactinospora lopnorensis TaxID=1352348 RepID=UPI000695AF7B|nr:hypothetical protein [Allosalinactinospora lopnorensis]